MPLSWEHVDGMVALIRKAMICRGEVPCTLMYPEPHSVILFALQPKKTPIGRRCCRKGLLVIH